MGKGYMEKRVITILMSLIIILFFLFGICFISYQIGKESCNFDDATYMEYTEEYNCVDFSNDLVEKLKERGIQSETVTGYQSDGTRHMWVGVWVEPQTGKFTKGYTK